VTSSWFFLSTLCTENSVDEQTVEAWAEGIRMDFGDKLIVLFYKTRLRQLGKTKRNYALTITNNLIRFLYHNLTNFM